MTARFTAWWRLRSGRERRLLLVMAELAAVVLAWLLVLRPVDDRLAAARRALADATIAEARVRGDAAEVRRIERAVPRRVSQPLAGRVAALAGQAGIAIEGLRRDGDGVALTIAAVRAPALLGWLDRLERREGLVVERLTLRADADRTLRAELTLRGRR